MDESQTLDALATILTSLSQTPFDISLHVQHIRLAQSVQSIDQSHLSAAREMFTIHFPAGDEVWMPIIKEKEESVDLNEAEGILDVLELFSKAEADYFCQFSQL
jgi:squamous cell carcinoma antigen recognized by T-cells 3